MARITQVVVTCDLEDGDVSASDYLTFSFNGKTYTLDLCKNHFNEVKGVLEGFANAGHSAGRGGRGRRRGAAPAGRAPRASRSAAAPRGESQAEIREWARAQGYAVGDRGRIPAEVRSAYEAAQSKGGRRRS
ncbi:MAG TPA: Lsr2 family protein [Acidimicrobiales bacterium]|nr:Lsr2 family protein [Acidimicrobiales bacterium]